MRAVAEEAGLSAAAAYRHFASKQDILMTLVEQTVRDLIEKLRPAGSAELEPTGRLSLATELLVQFHTERQLDSFVGNSELRSLSPLNRERVVALRDQVERVFRDILEEGVQTGDFGTPYPKETARAVVAMSTAVANWFRPAGELSSQEIARRYAEMARAMASPNCSTSD